MTGLEQLANPTIHPLLVAWRAVVRLTRRVVWLAFLAVVWGLAVVVVLTMGWVALGLLFGAGR